MNSALGISSMTLGILAVATAVIVGVESGRSLDGDNVLFSSDNFFDQSVSYQAIPHHERREMQQEILTLLGLHHRPVPLTHATQAAAPRYMMNLYKSLSDEDEINSNDLNSYMQNHDSIVNINANNNDDIAIEAAADSGKIEVHDADTIMSFVNHAHDKKHKNAKWKGHMRHDGDKRLWFDVSEVSAAQDIIAAHLRLYRKPQNDKLSSSHNYTINVYQIHQGQHVDDRELKKLHSVTVSPMQAEGWIHLNVTTAISDWVIYPYKNLGLFVTVGIVGREREVSPTRIGVVGHKGPDNHQAFMTAFFKTPTALHVRNTRAARRRQKKQSSTYTDDFGWNPYANFHDRHSRRSCQKRTLYVSFRDLGWQDWIIAPDGYAAFYCHGECSFPLNAHMNATNHAIVQTLVHLMNPYTVPKPCCAPTKLSAISVLYFDDNSNVILKKYKNMVVKSCGCH